MTLTPDAARGQLSSLAEARAVRDEAVRFATAQLRRAVQEAHEAGVPKVDIAELARVSRPTVDKWLEEK